MSAVFFNPGIARWLVATPAFRTAPSLFCGKPFVLFLNAWFEIKFSSSQLSEQSVSLNLLFEESYRLFNIPLYFHRNRHYGLLLERSLPATFPKDRKKGLALRRP